MLGAVAIFLPKKESSEMVLIKTAFRSMFSKMTDLEDKIDDLSTVTEWENQRTIYAPSVFKIEEGYREMDVS